jgi:CBS domain-containing protein
MRNSEAFLNAFIAVETWLKQQIGAERSMTFYQLVERNAQRSSTVRRFREDLKQFADLRNALVHERRNDAVLAEPTDAVVRDLERMRATLTRPPTVLPRFRRHVKTCDVKQTVGVAARLMRTESYSQVPILSNGVVVGLLTSETIARWLASEVENDVISLFDTTVEAVLRHTEDHDHYRYLASQAPIDDALTLFEDFATRGKTLNAILITPNGRPGPVIDGILTIHDLPDILQDLGVSRVVTA